MNPVVCDIDGVLADFDSCFRSTLFDVCGIDRRHITRAPVWGLRESYGITQEEHDKVWASRILQVRMADAPLYPHSKRLASILPKGSFYVTARGSNLKHDNAVEFRKLTIEWLLNNDFPDHTVVFSDNKVEFCQRFGIEKAIDDAPHHVEAYSAAGITCYMPIMLYNEHVSTLPNVVPLKGWSDGSSL